MVQPSVSSLPARRRIDGAVAYAMGFRAWQALAGVAVIVLIARYLAPAQQGYYYAFASLIALQSFLDLGLYLVISVCASHEWSQLGLSAEGRIEGHVDARSRLVSLGRFLFKWYGFAALAFCALASLIGLHFFDLHASGGVEWRQPWLLHVLFSSALLWLTPFLSLLEGCDQVASTSRFRLMQSVAGFAAFWATLGAGGALWAVAAQSAVNLAALFHHLLWTRRAFMSAFVESPQGQVMSWSHDLLPMQWRLAVQGIFTYLAFPFYTSLTFSRLGAVEGGRLGMTLQIVTAAQTFALVLVASRAPRLAILAAQRNFDAMYREWLRAAIAAAGLFLVLMGGVLAALGLARYLDWAEIRRVLPMQAFVVLTCSTMLTLFVQCLAYYLRAHRRERLTLVGVLAGALYGISAWFVVGRLGGWGVLYSHLVVTGVLTVPLTTWIFRKYRRDWTAPSMS